MAFSALRHSFACSHRCGLALPSLGDPCAHASGRAPAFVDNARSVFDVPRTQAEQGLVIDPGALDVAPPFVAYLAVVFMRCDPALPGRLPQRIDIELRALPVPLVITSEGGPHGSRNNKFAGGLAQRKDPPRSNVKRRFPGARCSIAIFTSLRIRWGISPSHSIGAADLRQAVCQRGKGTAMTQDSRPTAAMLDLADWLVAEHGLAGPDRCSFQAVRTFLDRNSARYIGLERGGNSWHEDAHGQSPRDHTSFALPAVLDVVEMGRVAARPLDFVLPGLVSGTVGTLFSPGATGKSFLMLETAVAIACADLAGTDLLGWGSRQEGGLRPGKVFYIAGEDPPPVLHMRLHAVIAAIARKHGPGPWRADFDAALRRRLQLIPSIGSQLDLLDEEHVDLLCKTAQGARLIVLDTLSRVHTADENSNAAMAGLVRNFERIATATGAALILLHHVAKAAAREQKGDEQQASRGASVLVDNARWGAALTRMSKAEAEALDISEDRRHFYVRLAIPKNNYSAPIDGVWFERRQGGVLVPSDSAEQLEDPASSKRAFRLAQLRHKHRGGPPPDPIVTPVAKHAAPMEAGRRPRNGAI